MDGGAVDIDAGAVIHVSGLDMSGGDFTLQGEMTVVGDFAQSGGTFMATGGGSSTATVVIECDVGGSGGDFLLSGGTASFSLVPLTAEGDVVVSGGTLKYTG